MARQSSCLTSARFTMKATVINQGVIPSTVPPLDEIGEWYSYQDPSTGEIIRRWRDKNVEDNPDTPADETYTVRVVDCVARGIVDGGIRVAGSTERFGENYENIDYVKLWVPANVKITKRDRVTNITDSRGHVQWLDDESTMMFEEDANTEPKATVFNVNGVSPLFDAFNRTVEQFVLLQRVEVSDG